jgi:hypothetical protein
MGLQAGLSGGIKIKLMPGLLDEIEDIRPEQNSKRDEADGHEDHESPGPNRNQSKDFSILTIRVNLPDGR